MLMFVATLSSPPDDVFPSAMSLYQRVSAVNWPFPSAFLYTLKWEHTLEGTVDTIELCFHGNHLVEYTGVKVFPTLARHILELHGLTVSRHIH